MRKIWNKGHRIRASDKHLVYHFSIGTLLFVFVAVLLLLNSKQLMRTDWEHFSLLENGLTLSPYNFITNLSSRKKEYHLKNITFRNIRIAKNGQKEDGIYQKYCENLVFENISMG